MFNSDEKFPCTMCGACCANVGKVVEQAKVYEIDLGFNFPINEDGSCGHRITMNADDGKPVVGCAIYERRPFICQVELGVPDSMTRQEYFTLTAEACNKMQEQQGIDESFRVSDAG